MKYDGERNHNKYTVKLLYNDLRKGSLGKDTDNPFFVINEIYENETKFPIKEVVEGYDIIYKECIIPIISEYGSQSIILVKLEEREDRIYYFFYIQTKNATQYISDFNYHKALKYILKK